MVDEHLIDEVDDGDGAIVVTCRGGWRSTPSAGAAHACSQWDRHAGVTADATND